jgi:type III secretion system FlhB-like substrate exporter
LITDGLASCTLLRFDPQSQSVPLVVGRETGPAGVQLLQRCLQSKVPVHEAAELQQELSRTTGGILPERLWPPIAELLSRQTENKTETKTAGEPEIPERVSS